MSIQEEIISLQKELSNLKKARNSGAKHSDIIWNDTTRRISNIKSTLAVLKQRL